VGRVGVGVRAREGQKCQGVGVRKEGRKKRAYISPFQKGG